MLSKRIIDFCANKTDEEIREKINGILEKYSDEKIWNELRTKHQDICTAFDVYIYGMLLENGVKWHFALSPYGMMNTAIREGKNDLFSSVKTAIFWIIGDGKTRDDVLKKYDEYQKGIREDVRFFALVHELKGLIKDGYDTNKIIEEFHILKKSINMNAGQYKKSIKLGDLATFIADYRFKHPEDKDKMVYFDCLAIKGEIEKNGEILELI